MSEIKVDRLIVDIEARTRQFEKSLAKVSKDTANLAKQINSTGKAGAAAATQMAGQFDKLNRSIASAGSTFIRAFGAGVGIGALTQLPSVIAKSVSQVGNLAEAAQKAGVSIRDLQKIQYAGIGSGLGLEDIVSNLTMFNKRVGEASLKGGDLAKLFEANGIAIRNGNGELRSTVDLLADVADLIANAKSEQERTVIATMALGRGGAALIPLLIQGGDAMKQLMKNAEDAGFVIDEKLVNKADAMADKWTAAAGTFKNIWMAMVTEVATELDKLAEFDDWLRNTTGKGLFKNPISDVTDPQGKAAREARAKIENAVRFQGTLESGWRERVDEREILRQQPELDDLGKRRMAILDEEIGRYDRLIKAHKAYIEQLRSYAWNAQPDVRPPPGSNRGGTIIPSKADGDAADAERKRLAEVARVEAIAEQNLLLDKQKRILDEIEAEQQKIADASGAIVDSLRGVTMSAMDDIKSIDDALLSMFKNMTKQLVDAFLFGGGPFAGIFGTAGQNGAPGGVIGNLIGGLVGRTAGKTSHPLIGAPGGVQPGLSSPGLAGGVSNADYFAPFGDALSPLAKKMVPAGLLRPFLQGGSGAGAAMGGMSGVKGQVWDFFASKGLQPHQIAGIMGNVQAESAFNPNAVGDGGDAFGLFQWNNRRPNLFKHAGTNTPNTQQQLDFAWHELQTSESGAMRRLMGSKDVFGATKAFASFERPKGFSLDNPQAMAGWQERINSAQQIMAQSSQRLSTSLASTAQITQKAGSGFAGQFPTALQDILGSLKAPAGGGGGGIFDFLFGSVGFADGGRIKGKGGGRSDSNLAWVSDGEFIVNAGATAKHQRLLEAINSDHGIRLPAFAGGGHVGNSAVRQSGGARGMQVHYHDNVGVQVTQKQSNGIDGPRIDVLIERRAADAVNRMVPKMLRDGYGLKPSLVSRV